MRKGSPEDSRINEMAKRIKTLEGAVSSLFEILLQAGVINETPCRPCDTAPPRRNIVTKKTPADKPSKRYRPPNKEARDEARRGIEFLLFTTRVPEEDPKQP